MANIVAIIPARMDMIDGEEKNLMLLGDKPLIAHTILAARECSLIDKVIVSTDSEEIAAVSKKFGAVVPFMRPGVRELGDDTIESVLKHAVDWLSKNDGYKANIIVLLEPNHPFRPQGLIGGAIRSLMEKDLDSVFAAFIEKDNFWRQSDYGLVRLGQEGYSPREMKQPLYREMGGLVCATRYKFIVAKQRLGKEVGVVTVSDYFFSIDIRKKSDFWLAEKILEKEPSLNRDIL